MIIGVLGCADALPCLQVGSLEGMAMTVKLPCRQVCCPGAKQFSLACCYQG